MPVDILSARACAATAHRRRHAPSGAPRLPVRPTPSRVRPYALTGGRTRAQHVLLVETLVVAVDPPAAGTGDRLTPEMRAIEELCRRTRSVAEVSALLRVPLGVVRVLLSDLADQGRIRVHGTGDGTGSPDRALLERVLSGLRRL